MDESNRTPSVEHLLRKPLQHAVESGGYGAWRSIAGADAVSLAFGFPAPKTFERDALQQSIRTVLDTEGDRALGYVGGESVERLRSTVSQRAAARGIEVSRESVLLTNGGTHGIDSICRTILEPGDVVAVEGPTFMGALTVFRNFGVEILPIPVDDDGMDVDELEATIENRRDRGRRLPKLVYTIPTFQNPTGTTMSRDRRERLVELAATHDFLVLEDDAYADLRYDGDPVTPLAALDDTRVIHVGTFSKTIAPGLRLGWVLAGEPIRSAIETVISGGSPTFTRSIVGQYCHDGHLERALPSLRAEYSGRRDRLLESLQTYLPSECSWTRPAGGFFVWVSLPDDIDAEAMLPAAIENGVTYLPGSMFFPDERRGRENLRLSFSYADRDQIDEGGRVLGETIDATMKELPRRD